jgi:hypothetical protein
MNRLIAGLALTALIASPALARTPSHAHASGASNYVRSAPAVNDFARAATTPRAITTAVASLIPTRSSGTSSFANMRRASHNAARSGEKCSSLDESGRLLI